MIVYVGIIEYPLSIIFFFLHAVSYYTWVKTDPRYLCVGSGGRLLGYVLAVFCISMLLSIYALII